MIRRIIWFLKVIPAALVFGVPAIVLEFPFLLIVWLFTGKNALLWDNSPVGWISTGWRWKLFCWPLSEGEFK